MGDAVTARRGDAPLDLSDPAVFWPLVRTIDARPASRKEIEERLASEPDPTFLEAGQSPRAMKVMLLRNALEAADLLRRFRLRRFRSTPPRPNHQARQIPHHRAPRTPRGRPIRAASGRDPPGSSGGDDPPLPAEREQPAWLPRFLAKATLLTLDGCQLWQGARDRHGYGHFWLGGRMVLAHRLAYELEHGPVPDGLELHHTCRVRSCVAVEHLIAVTRAEHVRLTLEARRAR